MLKIKIALSAIVLASFFTFVSCSEDEKSQVAQNEKVASQNLKTTSQNLKGFAEEFVNSYSKLKKELSKNKKIDVVLLNSLLINVKNDNDLQLALKKAGVSNSTEVISLVNNVANLSNDFIKNNPSIKKLSAPEVNSLLNEDVANVYKGIALEKNQQVKKYTNTKIANLPPTCQQQYTRDVQKCESASGACVIGGITTAWLWGPVTPQAIIAVVVGCGIVELACDYEAINDYNTCNGG
jgi:hypothetical protein